MNLVGKRIKHKTLGVGVVTAHDGEILTIEFSTKISRFRYTELTFKKFLAAEDINIQQAILEEFDAAKTAEEIGYKAENIVQLKAAEEQAVRDLAQRTTVHSVASRRKTATRQARIPGRCMTFYVFQGSTFDRESRNGYIWAPISNKAGRTFHHWDRLCDVHPGDIILHGYNAHVQAVSIARSECYECNQPEELRTENLWDQEGRRVDCEYIIFKSPIRTAEFVDDILRLCNVKYAPFDKDGNGNMGYLYEIHRELAKIFLHAGVARNHELKDVDFISEFLAEGDDK